MVKLLSSLLAAAGGSLIIYGFWQQPAQAQQSANFRFIESSIGGSGFQGSESANFQSSGASGLIGLGNSASTNVQVNAGHVTTSDPTLTFSVNSSAVNFGTFSAAVAATATATFEVINYTSYGYVVQILGEVPKYGSHEIDAMASTGPSQVGVEQFGLNLVANTSPISFGANPDQGQFGFGVAASNYNTVNNFRFVSGETIASAPKSSGNTIYTISYIVNVASLTPGGQYSGNQTILCVGTY